MSEQTQHRPKRRSTHIEMEAAYAAVGASTAEDLLKFPPEGTTPFQDSVLLGSGEERFLAAATTLMTWGAHRAAGVTVTQLEREAHPVYRPLGFSEEGQPEIAAPDELRFAPDGTPYLEAGDVVEFTWENGSHAQQARVVSTIEEPYRVGFTVGSTSVDEVAGEKFYTIEHRDDDTVWATVRGFLMPQTSGVFGIKGKGLVKAEIAWAHEHLVALTPVGAAVLSTHADAESARAKRVA